MDKDKILYGLIIIVLLLWIINDLIPYGVCEQSYVSVFHWNSCENFGLLNNILEILLYIGSAVTILLALTKLTSKTH